MGRVTTILFIFVMVMTAPACHRESEQDRVGKVITDIQAAAEEKDVRKIMDHVAKVYSDPQGSNRETVRRILLGYFLRYPKVSAYVTNLEISVENTSARVVIQAVLTSGKKTGSVTDVIPESLGMYLFDVSLKKESGDWKVASAQWTPVEMMKTGEAEDP